MFTRSHLPFFVELGFYFVNPFAQLVVSDGYSTYRLSGKCHAILVNFQNTE